MGVRIWSYRLAFSHGSNLLRLSFLGIFFLKIHQFEAMLASHHWPGNARCSPSIGELQPRNPGQVLDTFLRFPCLCCDGPGPNDCVICSEGIDNFWHPQGVVRLRRLDWPHTIQNWKKSPCLYGFSNEISVWALYFSQLNQVMHAMIMTVMGLEPAWKEMEASEPCDYVSLYRQQLLILHFQGIWHHCGLTGRRTRQLFLWICGRRGLMCIFEFWRLMLKQKQALSTNILPWWRWT